MIFAPSSPVYLNVPFIEQQRSGQCLAACAAMVCAYNGVSVRYERLVRILEIKENAGTAFYRIVQLERLGVHVFYEKRGTLERLYAFLQGGWPCIVGVETANLPYWEGVNTPHAVVVIGMDSTSIYLNDPAFPQGVLSTSIGDFDLAWLETDEEFAILGN